jgi:type IV pilus assembly protein PilE
MDRIRGFTLFELVIAVAIATVIATLAVTSYSHYVFRTRRTDAKHMLMSIAHSEERWYATYNRYTDDPRKLGYADPLMSPHAYYEMTLAVTGTDAQAYVVTARPIGSQAGDVCGSFTIDNTGSKTPDRADEAANANGSCW